MLSDNVRMSGIQFVTGVVPHNPQQTVGVPNPYGSGSNAFEPYTQLHDPASDPLMAGSELQLSGQDAIAKEKAAQAAHAGVTAIGGGTGSAPAGGSALSFINAAKGLLGLPYVWGGSTAAGVDCSGLVYYALNQAGIKVPRLTAGGYAQMGQGVTADQARAGDLVYWSDGGAGEEHMAIYLGGGMVIQAPETGDVVKISHVWGNPVYRRVIADGSFATLAAPSGQPPVLGYAGQPAADVFTNDAIRSPIGIRSPIDVSSLAGANRSPNNGSFKAV